MAARAPLLKTHEAASRLALSHRTLEKLRRRGDGPLFVKIGRAVRYRPSDLDRWLASMERTSTSTMPRRPSASDLAGVSREAREGNP